MVAKALYSMDLGTHKVTLSLPDSYSGIAADVGLTPLAAGSADMPPASSPKALVSTGKAGRLRLSFATTTGRRQTANIICATDKLATAVNSLKTKQYAGKTIATAYFPSRRRYT